MTGLPYRQLSRLITELFVSFDEVSLGLLPNRFAEVVVFVVVARTCAPDWIAGRVIRAPGAPDRSITVNAIATSLFRSVETTRRHVAWLIDHGLLIRTSGGVALSTAPAAARRTVAWYRAYHDLLLRLIAEIGETCDLDFDTGATMPVDALAVVERSLDIALLPLSPHLALSEDPVGLLVWITIGAANIRHVTFDPVLSRRYRIDSSPDEVRRPVSLHSIAGALGLPYATAWRKAQALEAARLVSRRDNGWVVLTGNLRAEEVEESVTSVTRYILRKIRELVRLGIDPADLGAAWIGDRPPLASLTRPVPACTLPEASRQDVDA